MTRVVRVAYLDDIDESEGATEVRFSLNGSEYEIDLSKEHQAELQAALQPFIDKARTGNRKRRPKAQKV